MLSFTSTTSVTSAIVVKSSGEAVLAVLHDPYTLARLNPLVQTVVASQEHPDTYTITDRFHFLGLSFNMTYTATLTILADGSDFQTRAGAGTTITNTWRAEEVAEGIKVTEEATIQVTPHNVCSANPFYSTANARHSLFSHL